MPESIWHFVFPLLLLLILSKFEKIEYTQLKKTKMESNNEEKETIFSKKYEFPKKYKKIICEIFYVIIIPTVISLILLLFFEISLFGRGFVGIFKYLIQNVDSTLGYFDTDQYISIIFIIFSSFLSVRLIFDFIKFFKKVLFEPDLINWKFRISTIKIIPFLVFSIFYSYVYYELALYNEQYKARNEIQNLEIVQKSIDEKLDIDTVCRYESKKYVNDKLKISFYCPSEYIIKKVYEYESSREIDWPSFSFFVREKDNLYQSSVFKEKEILYLKVYSTVYKNLDLYLKDSYVLEEKEISDLVRNGIVHTKNRRNPEYTDTIRLKILGDIIAISYKYTDYLSVEQLLLVILDTKHLENDRLSVAAFNFKELSISTNKFEKLEFVPFSFSFLAP